VWPLCRIDRGCEARVDRLEVTTIQQVAGTLCASQTRANGPGLKDTEAKFHLNVAQRFSVFMVG